MDGKEHTWLSYPRRGEETQELQINDSKRTQILLYSLVTQSELKST